MQAALSHTNSNSLLELTAAELMTSPARTIPQEMSLHGAARLLSMFGISGAPIVDSEGRCVGVLSSSDFVTWVWKGREKTSFIAPRGEVVSVEDSPEDEIRHYMTPQPVMVAPTTSIGELARMMVDAHIHRLLVVHDHDRPCGIVSSTDILAAIARAAQGLA